MSRTDMIADMLTRIRNGQMSKLISVKVTHAKIHENILAVLKEEGYISSFEVNMAENGIKEIIVTLKYRGGNPAIKRIARISKPGRRMYKGVADLNKSKYYNGLGVRILTTPQGVISDKEAIDRNIGGEIICEVY